MAAKRAPFELVPVETESGTIQGVYDTGVLAFKGVPYGASTGGAHRFETPRPADPWTGTRLALFWGSAFPQASREQLERPLPESLERFLFYRGTDPVGQSEDSLRLNVWSRDLSGKRPVMVFLHGGALFYGSGNELLAYDGANLALTEDVVVLTFNHRLNILGFMDFRRCGGGSESVNLGLQDVVLLLRWVRNNIAAFGGDPENVTVFGQSGGGMKVASLLSMPSAAGLFHKAIIQSGSFANAFDPEESARITEAFLVQHNCSFEDLKEMPIERLMQFTAAADVLSFRPTIDGDVISEVLLGEAGSAAASALSASIPLIVGSCQNELVSALVADGVDEYSEEQLVSALGRAKGRAASELLATFRATYPRESAFGLHATIASTPFRVAAVRQLDAKIAQGGNAWGYMFAWKTPVLGGRLGTFHSADLAFTFKNAALCARQTGQTAGALDVQEQMGGAWAAFARTGNPNVPDRPGWDDWSINKSTRVFDVPARQVQHFDDQCLEFFDEPVAL